MKPNNNDDVCRMFMMMHAKTGTEIVDYECIGDFEYRFDMSDGTKLMFDELDETCCSVKTHSNNALTEDEWVKEFSRKLKRKVRLAGTTLKDISAQTGIPYITMKRYANGICIPNAMAINQIAKALNCDVTELVDFDYLL